MTHSELGWSRCDRGRSKDPSFQHVRWCMLTQLYGRSVCIISIANGRGGTNCTCGRDDIAPARHPRSLFLGYLSSRPELTYPDGIPILVSLVPPNLHQIPLPDSVLSVDPRVEYSSAAKWKRDLYTCSSGLEEGECVTVLRRPANRPDAQLL